jgi:hypothetical protein
VARPGETGNRSFWHLGRSNPVPAKQAVAFYATSMPRLAPFLRPVTCPKCGRAVADYWEEPDGYPWVVPRRASLHETSAPLDVSAFGLPPGNHENTFTFRCECGATPSYRTSQIAVLAHQSSRSPEPPSVSGPRPPRVSRRIRLPS